MNRAPVDRIADAVLYEGYILYPYRPSIKNRQRWTFGGLFPEAYCQARGSGDVSSNQTECLVSGTRETRIESVARFLHLTARQVGDKGNADPFRDFNPVETLRVGEQVFYSWQEAEEREVALGEITVEELLAHPRHVPFQFPGGRRIEPVRDAKGEVAGMLLRQQQTIEGVLSAEAVEVGEGLYRLTFRIANCTPMVLSEQANRDEALLRSLVSAHTILGVRQGEFVSLLDPPEPWREIAAACRNVGVWPVLVGAEGQKDTLLSAPIILYDYPQVAPESPGDFFDSTEIDEMLTLRILTLTDEEKLNMAAVDGRARALLERTERLGREHLAGLHGTIRGLRPTPGEDEHG